MKNFKIISFFVFLCYESYLCQDVFITKNFESDYFCVTNSSFALTAISEIWDNSGDDVTYYVPKANKNRISKITNDTETYSYYRKEPWTFQENVWNGIILDERWEDFTLITTIATNKLEYVPVGKINNSKQFEIPFSIRIKYGAHVFLCDNADLLKSNCYWFLLDTFGGNANVLQKCVMESVPKRINDFSCNPYQQFQNNYTENNLSYLSDNKWSHILLSKIQNFFEVKLMNSYNTSRIIMNWTDTEELINVKYMFVNSQFVDGLWRVHTLDYIETHEDSHYIELGKPFTPENKFACISMYIKMCAFCKIELFLSQSNTILHKELYENNSNNWMKIKITAENITSNHNVSLHVSTIGTTSDKYWIIDQVRICQKQEFRVVKMTEKKTCQLMSEAANFVTFKHQPVYDSECSGDAIGPFCVPCNWIYPYECYRMEICTQSTCRCSAKNLSWNCQDTPPKVGKLDFYSKTENSVSLRWQPLYSPPGESYTYWIQTNGGKIKNERYIPEKCFLWPHYHCATIHNLERKRFYTFTVQALNIDQELYGEEENITVFTDIESPGPPENLQLLWTAANDLNITWQHPKRSNGDIHSFHITITPENSTTSRILERLSLNNRKDYQQIYFLQVPKSKLTPSMLYSISVMANNSLNGTETWKTDTSPPETPMLNHIATYFGLNSSITIQFTLQEPMYASENYQLDLYWNDTSADHLLLIDKCSIKTFGHVLLTIGHDGEMSDCSKLTTHLILIPGKTYNFILDVSNTYKNKTSRRKYDSSAIFDDLVKPSNYRLLALLALLLIIPVLIIVIMKRKEISSSIRKRFCGNNSAEEVDNYNKFLRLPTYSKLKELHKQTDTDKDPEYQETLRTQNTEINLQDVTVGPYVYFNPIETDEEPIHQPTRESLQVPIYNLCEATEIHSKAIEISAYKDYVRTSLANGELESQHALLFPKGTEPFSNIFSNADEPQNSSNTSHVYEHTKVVLNKIRNDTNAECIDANYIDGYKTSKAYIAAQKPKQELFDDFWEMIWQENVQNIMMVSDSVENGKKTIDQYWPDDDKTAVFGEITVQFTSSEMFSAYECRVFKVTRKQESRELQQLHFLSWPDHGFPLYTEMLVPFLKRMLLLSVDWKSPILVHYSDGFDKTGIVILSDICLRMAKEEKLIDVLKTFQEIGKQRSNMINTIQQYKFVHLLILECLDKLDTSIPCSSIEKHVQQVLNEGIERQMSYLAESQWQEKALKNVDKKKATLIIPEKNRILSIIPETQARVFLSCYPANDKTSSYINAVRVDGFRTPNQYIVTQQPLPNTLGDFWRLVNENNVSVIVSLNKVDVHDGTSCIFWPTENSTTMNPIDFITLTHLDSTVSNFHCLTKINLSTTDCLKEILLISLNGWESHIPCPNNINQFLTFWKEANALSKRSKTVLITCYDGVTASGLYIAMSFIIEKMRLEQLCDVFQAVRTIRYSRPEFVTEKNQYEFLYKAAVSYMKEFVSTDGSFS